jgi:hypothetical protein
MGDRYDSREFYELMQNYRYASVLDQPAVTEAFEAVKEFARSTPMAGAEPPKQGEEKRCKNCDDTGDVHSIDGEWRGICHCPAGDSMRGLSACVTCGAPSVEPAPSLQDILQQQCSDWGVYWRAPDAHGVELSCKQALELLRTALRVEVDIVAPSSPKVEPAGWQPIETAPRGGRILVRAPGLGPCVASAGWRNETPDVIVWEVINDITCEPTEWHPLPPKDHP